MEDQEKKMRAIPKNVRQIGELDGELRLYVEDYVNTFIRKCAGINRPMLGALVGDWYLQDGKEYLFVEGAVKAEGYTVSDGRIRLPDEAWSGIYGKLSEHFGGRSICGWFLCSGDENPDIGMLRGFMYENLGIEKRVLIYCNGESESESFFVYDQNFIREQPGYYLFYERNEPMQSYMVTTSLAVRTDPVAVDAITPVIRTRNAATVEIPRQQGSYSVLSAAALIVGILALAFGIVTFNHYEQLREMESVLTHLTGVLLGAGGTQGETEEETVEETEEETAGSGGLIIEDVEGGVTPEVTTQEEEASSEPEGDTEEEVAGTVSPEESFGEETSASEPEEPTEAVDAPEYFTYVVGKGETLVSICWRVYGCRDDEIIRQICEINGIADKNCIYAGQELLIP